MLHAPCVNLICQLSFTDAMRWVNLEWMDLAGGIGMHGSIIHGMAVASG
jgi:hypothetical protein